MIHTIYHHVLESCMVMYGLGGGFKYCLFSPLLGDDSHFDECFSTGLKPPTSGIFAYMNG